MSIILMIPAPKMHQYFCEETPYSALIVNFKTLREKWHFEWFNTLTHLRIDRIIY